jgi:hypothetical protein
MNIRAVRVCTKTGTGRNPGHKKHAIIEIFTKTASEKRFLDCSR